MTRAALYARVSTEDQAERYGLASQLRELRQAAATRGYVVTDDHEYVDDGWSGSTLERPALRRLRAAVGTGAIDVVLVYDADRLSRDLREFLNLRHEWQQAGVRVEYLAMTPDETPMGKALLGLKGIFAELERDLIVARTRRGLREKALRGLKATGVAPYGYRTASSGHLEPDPIATPIVQRIFSDLVEHQRTVRQIVAALRAEGVPPPRKRTWTAGALYKLLRARRYIGAWNWGQRHRAGGKLVVRPAADWIAVSIPALVSRQLWEAAQAQLTRNRSQRSGRPSTALLRGLVRCGTCGRTMRARARRPKDHYYICDWREGILTARPCAGGATPRVERLEALVWDTVSAVLRRPEVLTARLEAYQTRLGVQDVEVQSEIVHLKAELASVGRQEGRAVNLYCEEGLDASAVRAKLEELRARREALIARLARVTAQESAHASAAARQASVQAACAAIVARLDTLDRPARQTLLQRLLDAVVVHRDRVELHGVVPWGAAVPGEAPDVGGELTPTLGNQARARS